MQRQKAVEILTDDGPKGARALLKAALGNEAENCWPVLGRLQCGHGDWTTEDNNWTVIAIRKQTLQPWMTSGTLGHLDSIGSFKVEDEVSKPGYAHQDRGQSGLWVWFKDRKSASPNA